jgi:cyclase
VAQVRDYLVFVADAATTRHDAGMSAWDAAQDIALGEFGDWGEFGRLAVNVEAVYRDLEPDYVPAGIVEQFRRMAELEERGRP